jgi:phosphopantetheine adenylyltransferase
LIREVASLGGDLSNLIPESIHKRLQQHLEKRGS